MKNKVNENKPLGRSDEDSTKTEEKIAGAATPGAGEQDSAGAATPGEPAEPVTESPEDDAPDNIPAAEVMNDAPPISPNVDELVGSGEVGGGNAPGHGPGAKPDTGAFDPEIHVVDKVTGEPKRNKDGSFRRRHGRKKETESVIADSAQVAGSDGSKAAAIVTVAQIEIIGRLIGGDEWQYVKRDDIGIDERQQGVDAFTAYFQANGVVDIPPGVAIAIWGFGYIAPRFTMPKTQSRVKLVGAWIGDKWARFRHRKRKPRTKPVEKKDAPKAE